jgi:hypothetical protein
VACGGTGESLCLLALAFADQAVCVKGQQRPLIVSVFIQGVGEKVELAWGLQDLAESGPRNVKTLLRRATVFGVQGDHEISQELAHWVPGALDVLVELVHNLLAPQKVTLIGCLGKALGQALENDHAKRPDVDSGRIGVSVSPKVAPPPGSFAMHLRGKIPRSAAYGGRIRASSRQAKVSKLDAEAPGTV